MKYAMFKKIYDIFRVRPKTLTFSGKILSCNNDKALTQFYNNIYLYMENFLKETAMANNYKYIVYDHIEDYHLFEFIKGNQDKLLLTLYLYSLPDNILHAVKVPLTKKIMQSIFELRQSLSSGISILLEDMHKYIKNNKHIRSENKGKGFKKILFIPPYEDYSTSDNSFFSHLGGLIYESMNESIFLFNINPKSKREGLTYCRISQMLPTEQYIKELYEFFDKMIIDDCPTLLKNFNADVIVWAKYKSNYREVLNNCLRSSNKHCIVAIELFIYDKETDKLKKNRIELKFLNDYKTYSVRSYQLISNSIFDFLSEKHFKIGTNK